MAFLAPWFLAGLAALALPVLLHLRRNRPQKRIAFSSLMFLDATPPVTRRSSKLQDILLLLLRCLGLALLVLAFARPFFRPAEKNPAAASGSAAMHFILIDTSASMRGAPLEKAVKEAARVIDGIHEGDWIAVAAFSDRLRPLLAPVRAKEIPQGDRKAEAKSLLAGIQPGWEASKPDAGWSAAASMAAEAAEEAAIHLHVFGDLKKGASYEGLRGEDWPEALRFTFHRIGLAEDWSNAGVQVLAGGGTPRVRVTNAEGSSKSDFTLDWGKGSAPQLVSVPAGEMSVMDAPDGITGEGALKLTGDDLTFDNESAWAPPVRPMAEIRYLGNGDASDSNESRFFLTRAMQSTAAYDVEIDDLKPPDLTVASGVLGDAEVASLRAALEAGGNALLTLRDVESAASLGKILGVPAADVREAEPGNFALLGEIDFGSSVFSPFADPRYSDFSSIRFWKHRVLPQAMTASAAVLARFDSGDPAWLRYEVGKGALHVLTTTWRPVDSQLALSTKFPPLLHSLLAQSPALAVRAERYFIGQPVPLPEGTVEVTLPDGTKAAVEAGKPFTATTVPGIYRAGREAFAVQVDPSESEVTPLSEAELGAFGLPSVGAGKSAGSPQGAGGISDVEQESRQRIGWWLLIVAAAAFFIETLWAAHRASRANPVPA